MAGGDDNTLIKVAVFGIAMAIVSTCLVSFYIQGTSDYDYETIQNYRNDLSTYTGGLLTNDTPWVLTGVYTPFVSSQLTDDSQIASHIDPDGWLFGQKITTYSEIGKAADIKLDKNQKSNQLLTVGDRSTYEYRNGLAWYNGGNDYGITIPGGVQIANYYKRWSNLLLGTDFDTKNTGYTMASVTANNWNYTGYRYTFDPTLPFKAGTSSKDGTLSIVWYDTGADTGISGGLQIYGNGREGNINDQVLLAHYSAYDIVAAYQSAAGYAQVYDFDFGGVHLNLSIRFNPLTLNKYPSLIDAWNAGDWTMAISSVSAGNFFDVENSNAFSLTAGGVFDTFIQIYTFDYPHFNDDWVDVIMWLLVGLPFSISLLCITMRVVGGVVKVF